MSSNLLLSDLRFLCEENMCATVFIYNDRFLWMTHLKKASCKLKKLGEYNDVYKKFCQEISGV